MSTPSTSTLVSSTAGARAADVTTATDRPDPDGLAHADAALMASVREALGARADPSRAPGLQAYMKSVMPYLGLSAPALRAVCRERFTAHRLPTFEVWRDTTLALWREARFREERYAAMVLAEHRFYRPFQQLSTLPLYRELIVTGAWWDYVDLLASHQVGTLLRLFPAPMARTLRAGARDEDMWLRRAAILAQLSFKQATDLRLLYDCIEPSMDSREFFLRKGIGWALRQYARTDAAEILRFVHTHRDRLSPLSKREALKAQLRSGTLTAVP